MGVSFYVLNCSWAISKSANWIFLRFLFVEGGIQTEGWLANGIFGISTCSIVGFGSGFSIPKISWISLSGDFFGKSVSSRMSILLLVFDSSEFSFQLIDYVGAFFSKKWEKGKNILPFVKSSSFDRFFRRPPGVSWFDFFRDCLMSSLFQVYFLEIIRNKKFPKFFGNQFIKNLEHLDLFLVLEIDFYVFGPFHRLLMVS